MGAMRRTCQTHRLLASKQSQSSAHACAHMPKSPNAFHRKPGDMSPATQEPRQKSAVVNAQALEVALGDWQDTLRPLQGSKHA